MTTEKNAVHALKPEWVTPGTLLRMAGNIAAGLAAERRPGADLWTPDFVAFRTWAIVRALLAQFPAQEGEP